jgi:23S rRNA (cytosine1962-C5)-methyltransferase
MDHRYSRLSIEFLTTESRRLCVSVVNKMLPVVVITDRARKRLKSKHPWIFSNEIHTKPEVEPGEIVRVQDERGHFIGIGYYNPHTLIAVRVLSTNSDFDAEVRIQSALDHRLRFYEDHIYRLIYSESDGLPGLIADRYNETLVLQILTAGMERMQKTILPLLIQKIQPKRILLRNDSPYRELEGLPLKTEWILGEPVEKEIVEIDGLKFQIDYSGGQKTGFFLDQQKNRKQLARFARGVSMLDAFSYAGGWALYGARAGMKEITAVDSSQGALAAARENAELNGYSITTIAEDVFEFLRSRYSSPSRYDLIVLDPPAFCKSRRQLPQAIKGYREINLRAMKLLNPGGVLITCSCSQPVSTEIFLDILREAASDSGRSFHLQDVFFQPPDHPVLLNFPESHYLKCVVLEHAP